MWHGDFFFFQAEDGIRDIGVTGVQTCALPISRRLVQRSHRAARWLDDREHGLQLRVHRHLDQRCIDAGTEVRVRRDLSQIGRASWRERVESSGGGVALKKKTDTTNDTLT